MLLEKKMLGEDSDEEEEADAPEGKRNTSGQDDEMGCTWGMGKKRLLKALSSFLMAPSSAFDHTAQKTYS